MQNDTSLDEEDTGYSLSHFLPGSTSIFGLTCKYLGLVLLMVSYSCLAACSADPSCSSNSLYSSCSATIQPTTSVHQNGQKPAAIQQIDGHAGFKPERARHLSPVATISPTPTPITIRSDEKIVLDHVNHYAELVTVEGSYSAFLKAYNLLDITVRDREPLSKFLNDPNYTLSKGCWREVQVTVTARDGQTWDGSVLLQQGSCVVSTVLVTYSWHFIVSMANGLPEIISIGLYATGTGN
jgi:hypothetical protein